MKTYEEYINSLDLTFDPFIPTKNQYEKMIIIQEKRQKDFLVHQKENQEKEKKYNEAFFGRYKCPFLKRGDHLGNPNSGDSCELNFQDCLYCSYNPNKLL